MTWQREERKELTTMGQNPEQNENNYGGYRGGYTPPASSGNIEDQPQSSYQHPESQSQGQQNLPPYGNPEQPYYQQQQNEQQQYYQQQQYNNQYYQPPFSSTHTGGTGDAGPMDMSSLGIRVRTAGWLSYIFGWVSGLVVLLTEKQNQFLRFHAMQSIIFSVAFMVLEWVVNFLPFTGRLSWGIGVAGLVIWIVLMVKASQGKYFKLPIIGEYAERFSRQIRL